MPLPWGAADLINFSTPALTPLLPHLELMRSTASEKLSLWKGYRGWRSGWKRHAVMAAGGPGELVEMTLLQGSPGAVLTLVLRELAIRCH